MRRVPMWVFVLSALSLLSSTAWAQQNLIESVKEGCQKELESFCKGVKPGEGRVLACLYAHEDELSGRCDYAVYDASAQLGRAVAALSYVANECSADLKQHCASVEAGEGRVAACLKKNEKDVTQRCKDAMKEIGVK